MTPDRYRQREQMVDRQIAARGVRDSRVLRAMRDVPRERFVPDGLAEFAYRDCPLPIGDGQTISQPYIVARMIEAAEVTPGDRVLEIGVGSGYAAGVMSLIADRVYGVERHPDLVASAADRLRRLGYANVEVRAGDGTLGLPDAAPFAAIIASAGGPEVPEVLKRQLQIGGRLVMPVGAASGQRLVKLTRTAEDSFRQEELEPVTFVPLIGEYGWEADGRTRGRWLAPPSLN